MDDEGLYEQVVVELSEGRIRHGLWAKALTESDGDEAAARVRYMKLRVEQLRVAEVAERRAARTSDPEAETRLGLVVGAVAVGVFLFGWSEGAPIAGALVALGIVVAGLLL